MIKVEHLTKCYGESVAVNDLSFELDEGHVYGFLGPNGAGKSTTMNIMTGCLAAADGRTVGYVPRGEVVDLIEAVNAIVLGSPEESGSG